MACLGATIVPAPVVAKLPPPKVGVPAATLITTGGVHLWSRRPHTERRVASTIKMLNALVVRDHTNLNDVVKVSSKAAAIDNGDVGLATGQRLTVRQLLEIMLVASANDAAEALAIHISGSEKAYVKLMNAKAKSLGLKHTRASDPHGLSKRECSSAHDLSVLSRRVLADKVLRGIVRKRSAKVPRRGGSSSTVRTTNRLLGHYSGIEGVKTGFTNPAGYCFVGAAKRGKVELVGVVLGADSVAGRFSEMRRLLDWGFANTHMRQLVSRDATCAVTPSGSATLPKVVAHPLKTVSLAILDHGGPIKRKVVLPKPVSLPVKAGQKLGTMQLRQGTTTLATVPLVALVDVSVPTTSSAPPTSAPAPEQLPSSGIAQTPAWHDVYVALLDLWSAVAAGA